jgi:hypothetical protein
MTDTTKKKDFIPRESVHTWCSPKNHLNRHGVYFTPKISLSKYVPSSVGSDKSWETVTNPDPDTLDQNVVDYVTAINDILSKHNLRAAIYLSIFTYANKGKVSISLYAGEEYLQDFEDMSSLIEYVVLLLGIIECQALGLIEVHTYKPRHDDKY